MRNDDATESRLNANHGEDHADDKDAEDGRPGESKLCAMNTGEADCGQQHSCHHAEISCPGSDRSNPRKNISSSKGARVTPNAVMM